VQVIVRDQARNRAASNMPRIFGRYQRADSKAAKGGLGLGLSSAGTSCARTAAS